MKTNLKITLIASVMAVASAGYLAYDYSKAGYTEAAPTCTDQSEGCLRLMISNQSFEIDPVDILVRIDDKLVVDKIFLVGNQHNYQTFEISLPKGTHTIYAETKAGKAQLEEAFVIDENLWIAISFMIYDGQLPILSFDVSEKQIAVL